MKIFVTGATGFVGFSVAAALRRAGHEVWGLTRHEGRALRLARHEIHPVIGSLQDHESFRDAIDRASIVVHAAVDYTVDTAALDRETVDFILSRDRPEAPKSLVYTSGVWIYGATRNGKVDEASPTKPIKSAAVRGATEKRVLEGAGPRGLVLRPGCVYGLQGGLTGLFFSGAEKAGAERRAARVAGDLRSRWAMVHADDLADAYVRAIEQGAGGIFNVVDRSRCSIGGMARAAARSLGVGDEVESMTPEEASQAFGPLSEGLALDQHVDAWKITRHLGWSPRHGGFIDGVDSYRESWKAFRGSNGADAPA
jgi:nucleoside-diphosphate-sugar epimerase